MALFVICKIIWASEHYRTLFLELIRYTRTSRTT